MSIRFMYLFLNIMYVVFLLGSLIYVRSNFYKLPKSKRRKNKLGDK